MLSWLSGKEAEHYDQGEQCAERVFERTGRSDALAFPVDQALVDRPSNEYSKYTAACYDCFITQWNEHVEMAHELHVRGQPLPKGRAYDADSISHAEGTEL
jgi:hypothetical protein